MTSIYVIESGSYSDYRVMGVYSTRENAELAAKIINEARPHSRGDDRATVDEWPLDPHADQMNAGRICFHVDMATETGECIFIGKEPPSDEEFTRASPAWTRPDGKEIPRSLAFNLWATDEKHAIKIANEKRLQIIAEGTHG